MTLMQFLFVVLITMPTHMYRPPNAVFPRLVTRHIPLHIYALYVLLFLGGALLNAYALGFRVSVPLLVVFRSGTLVASMITGYLVSKRIYTRGQILGVVTVTAGIILATFAQGLDVKKSASAHHNSQEIWEWWLGVFMLCGNLICGSLLGLLQERTYATYGNHWREGLLYSHLLSIPTLLIFWQGIKKQAILFNESTPMSLFSLTESMLYAEMPGIKIEGNKSIIAESSFVSLIKMAVLFMHKTLPEWIIHYSVPSLWVFLTINIITQYFCVSGVHRLTSMTTSVSVNLVLNIRKLISLLLSVWLFGNHLAWYGWLGTALVFGGTILYSLSTAQKHVNMTSMQKKRQDSDVDENSDSKSNDDGMVEKKSTGGIRQRRKI